MEPTPPYRIAAVALGATALLSLVLLAFAWPTSDIEPRDLPIAVVGPEEMAAGMVQGAGEDAFALTRADSRQEAVDLIEDREAYGAVVAGPGGVELLTASAASPAVADLLQEAVTQMAPDAGTGPPPTVTDVVPLPDGDPRGIVFRSGSLPLVLGGIITAGVLAVAVRGKAATLVTGAGVVVGAGLALAGMLQGWFDAIGGSYLANAGVMTLGLAAMAATITGLRAWLGTPGLALGAVLMMLLGNPLSGVTSAPELLPWGDLGQLLPPGAMGSALRSTAYFDGAGAAGPLAVLTGWAVLGVALVLTARPRQHAEQPVLENA